MISNNYNEWVWNRRMKDHFPESMKKEIIDLYDGCFDYSCYREYDEIMVFVTKCFIERNKQLDQKVTIVQVKMKFGMLTIYYEGKYDPYLVEITNTATKMAAGISKKIERLYGKGGPWNRKILQPAKSK